MMFLEGNIAAPPTITVFSPDSSLFGIFLSSAPAGATAMVVMASAEKATADNSANRLDMKSLPMHWAGRPPPATMATMARHRVVVAPSYARRLAGFRKNFFVLFETI